MSLVPLRGGRVSGNRLSSGIEGLDKFGSVHECIDWVKGPVGHFIHDSSGLTLSNTGKLEQAQKRQKKREVDECQSQSSSIAEVSS